MGSPADALYAGRDDLANARQAAEIWATDVRQDRSAYEPAWKLARVYYWLGTHAPRPERRVFLEQGIDAAQAAVRLAPDRPEGHFWVAANMGAIAEAFGMRAGLKYRRPIREELETVLRIDASFMEGAADRALGRYFHKVPALLGGSKTKAEAHLRASLAYNEESTISHYFLAELFLDSNRIEEARAELRRVLAAPLTGEWAPEDRDYKQKAAALLQSFH